MLKELIPTIIALYYVYGIIGILKALEIFYCYRRNKIKITIAVAYIVFYSATYGLLIANFLRRVLQ